MFGPPSKGQTGNNDGLTRRALLAGAGATVSTAALAVAIVPAVSADDVCALPIDTAEEYPVERVNRLADQLSVAMDGWMEDLGVDGVPPVWKAHVYPSKSGRSAVSFEQVGGWQEPLVKIIAAYRTGCLAFRGTPDHMTNEEEHEYVDATFGKPLRLLSDWAEPAQTSQGVIEALKLAADENVGILGSEMSMAMVRAALGYFEPTYIPGR